MRDVAVVVADGLSPFEFAVSVDAIAGRYGIGDAANLRDHFRRVVGTSPLGYRRTFRQQAS